MAVIVGLAVPWPQGAVMYDKNAWTKWYSNPENRAKHRKAVHRCDKIRVIRNKKWLDQYKLERGCKVCGFKEHPSALDFHHRDPAQKSFEIGSLHRKGWSLKRIQEEVNKCDILCANHHRMKHYGAMV